MNIQTLAETLNSDDIDDVKMGVEIALNFKENRGKLVPLLLKSTKWKVVALSNSYTSVYRHMYSGNQLDSDWDVWKKIIQLLKVKHFY